MSEELNIQFEEMEEDFSTGYVPSKKDLRDYKLNKKVCQTVNLPEAFEVEHSKIKNQHQTGSCVAHASAEILEEIESNRVEYSTAWIYGYRPVGYFQGVGMMPCDAMKTMKNVGCIQKSVLPQNIEIPEAKELVNKDLNRYKTLASHDKVISYARLRTDDEIKEAIYKTGKPVFVCIRTKGLKLDKNYVAEIPPIVCAGGHAVVCYGWNETGFLIQNSWGSTWGNKGCFILPYEYGFMEAWVITKDPSISVKPSAFWLRALLVSIGKFFERLFVKKS